MIWQRLTLILDNGLPLADTHIVLLQRSFCGSHKKETPHIWKRFQQSSLQN